MNKDRVIVMKAKDNVATATEEMMAGSEININVAGERVTIDVIENIPFGHKVAIRKIGRGEKIIKYGEIIGEATEDILPGQHTHVHNLAGCRGRGDLEKS